MLGEQFRMGRRMVPSKPELFRLIYDSLSGFYQDMDDGSYWQKTTLFDFGWGDEPGYYRYPMPTMQELLQLLLTATIEDDYFGAASVLLQDDAEEVLPLLESALQRPANRFHYEQVADLHELAATYLVAIASNHQFADGNKRAAFLAAGLFLHLNGLRLVADQADAAMTVLAVAAGERETERLAVWLKGRTLSS